MEKKKAAKKVVPPKVVAAKPPKPVKPEEIMGIPPKVEIRNLRLTNGVWFGYIGEEITCFCEGCRAEGRWVALNFNPAADARMRGRTLMTTGNCPRHHAPVTVSVADFWEGRRFV